jgi:putative membrane protein
MFSQVKIRYDAEAETKWRILLFHCPIQWKGVPLRKTEKILLLLIGAALLAFSGIAPYDRATWFMEVAPIFIVVPILIATGKRFPLTPLAYRLIFAHALILMVGGHYTYARVPLGFWVQDLLDLSRNHYDRLGHLAQGFIPAIIARELLLRTSPLKPGKWLFFIVTSICLAVSACYEFIEWWAALLGGDAADAFLGTQGDVWDTQWDMFLALVGAIIAQKFLARCHDGELAKLQKS